MTDDLKISAEDRRFFELLAEATFTNPFGDRREAIDLQIIGEGEASLTKRERFDRLRAIVAERFARLEEKGRIDLRRCPPEDFEVLRVSVLFDVYHRHCDEFDQIIDDQIQAGEKPCPVPFADEAISTLEQRGFSREDARRFFAILYQVRRAYYFIDRALVGRSACMKELRRDLWNAVFTHDIRGYERHLIGRMEDFSTLFLGETGTGKGTAAAAIGRSGFIPFDVDRGRFLESFTRAFVSTNLSQFSEQLIESELFGHRKGSFTGAFEDHEGLLSRCSPYGAIFLDEIGDLSVPVQIKLLQVLQDRRFVPVGAREERAFRGRVIAATNQPLDELRREGAFRDDFFYRLCTHAITVPPLRRRIREDAAELRDLTEHVLGRLLGEADEELAATVYEAILESVGDDYPWHGNVRELEQCVRRILLTKSYEPDRGGSRRQGSARLVEEMEEGGLSAQDVLSRYCRLLHERFGTLAEVARRTSLDRRTVKKYIEGAEDEASETSA